MIAIVDLAATLGSPAQVSEIEEMRASFDGQFNADRATEILESDTTWVTGRHTWVEVVRNLARLLEGRELVRMEAAFRRDWRGIHIVELDRITCERAAEIARAEGVRTLDALHLSAAQRIGGTALPFVPFDARQARAARAIGLHVSGC